jgi:hypothetical protein
MTRSQVGGTPGSWQNYEIWTPTLGTAAQQGVVIGDGTNLDRIATVDALAE